jgi:hypothetical protein
MNKTLKNIIGGLLVLFLCTGIVGVTAMTISNFGPGPENTILPESQMGSNPLFDTTNQHLWNLPYEEGEMTEAGRVNYVQSSKEGERWVYGYVGAEQNLVVTAYSTIFPDGQEFTNGIVYVIQGPFDLDRYPLFIKDGAATLVGKNATQAKLDSMFVDFCRGDRNSTNTAWTYNPWALAHVMLPEGFFFLDVPGDCFDAAHDTWPNNPPSQAGYETTSGDNSNASNSTVTGERLDTATNGGPISFTAGTPVIGYKIVLNDGTTYSGCYLADPAKSGTVTDGVVFPWDTEIAKANACK